MKTKGAAEALSIALRICLGLCCNKSLLRNTSAVDMEMKAIILYLHPVFTPTE